jgi:hypothetical protein
MGPNKNGHRQVSQLCNIIKQVLTDLSNKSICSTMYDHHHQCMQHKILIEVAEWLNICLSICFVIPRIMSLICMYAKKIIYKILIEVAEWLNICCPFVLSFHKLWVWYVCMPKKIKIKIKINSWMCKCGCVIKWVVIVATTTNYKKASIYLSISPDHNYTKLRTKDWPPSHTHCQQQTTSSKANQVFKYECSLYKQVFGYNLWYYVLLTYLHTYQSFFDGGFESPHYALYR